MGMFCYQCEQTAQGKGCTIKGVCGKEPSTSSLQDLLIYQLHGLGWLANEGRKKSVKDESVDKFIIEALFTTVTNVNFYDATIIKLIQNAEKIKTDFITKLRNAGVSVDNARHRLLSLRHPVMLRLLPRVKHTVFLQASQMRTFAHYNSYLSLASRSCCVCGSCLCSRKKR